MEIIYYPSPVPNNRYTISLLAILFDRVLLPGLYLPSSRVDVADLRSEFDRIWQIDSAHGHTPESLIYLQCLKFLEHYQDLSNIFVGTGQSGHLGILEKETQAVAENLEEVIYGPPPENFKPMIAGGFNFGLASEQINGPSWITYPANAYIVSQKRNIPLFSDQQDFPFPSSISYQSNANFLASYLSMSSLMLVLPRIKPLNAEQIIEVRSRLKDDIQELHVAALSLTDRYRQLVGENPSLEKLKKEADYLAETEVKPKLNALVKRIETPGQIIKRELLDFTIESPEILWRIKINPSLENWLDLLKLSSSHLKSGVNRYMKANEIVKQSGLSLLLKLPKKYGR